jgi:site-specific DNA-methyltransferase (adenine-specific)
MSHVSETIGNCTLYLGDCMEILPELEKVDAVVTDPPYGISYISSWRKYKPTEMLINDDCAPVEAVPLMASLLNEGSALYMATRFDVSGLWRDELRKCGLTEKTPIYWDKTNHTSGDLSGDFGAQIEIFLFYHKGRHFLRGPRLSNLWRIPRPQAGEHPTPKPVALMERIIECSTDHGNVVLDLFMGSGTTLVGCAKTGRRGIGIEIERKYFDISCKRVEAIYKQPDLFIPSVKKAEIQEVLL